jgi:hypothetical protein
MAQNSKIFTIFLVLMLVASSPIIVKTASAQITKLPVPEFTVRYIDESFIASTSPSIDPYTGESLPPTTYNVDNRYIQVSIKNNLPTISEGSPSQYYYNVRSKGQFTEDWTEAKTAAYGYYRPSTSAYTLINYTSFSKDLAVGTKIDFQVTLMYGGIGKNLSQGPLGQEYFVGETSGWSSTKTVTIGDTSAPTETTQATPTATAEPTQTPTATNSPTAYPVRSGTPQGLVLERDWQAVYIIVLAVVVTLLVGVIVFQHKKTKAGRGMAIV